MDQQIIFYGMAAAWIALALYVTVLLRKIAKLKQLIDKVMSHQAVNESCTHNWQWINKAKVKYCSSCDSYDIVLPDTTTIPIIKFTPNDK